MFLKNDQYDEEQRDQPIVQHTERDVPTYDSRSKLWIVVK